MQILVIGGTKFIRFSQNVLSELMKTLCLVSCAIGVATTVAAASSVWDNRCRGEPGGRTEALLTSPVRQIEKHDVRSVLHSFEYNLPAVRGDVEVPNDEVRLECGQLTFGPRLKVDLPEVLVLELS